MDNWLQQLQETLNAAARDSSDWFAAASQQADQAIEEWTDNSLEALEEIDRAIAPTLGQLNDRVDETLDAGLLFLEQQVDPWLAEATAPLTRTVNPWLQNHPACIGCRYYHGTEYGEEMLVCGMHPYGPDDKTCPDWASVWPDSADANNK